MKPKKKDKTPNKVVKQSRKQIRKQKRKEAKAKKNAYFQNKNKPGKFVLNPDFVKESTVKPQKQNKLPQVKVTPSKEKESLKDKTNATIAKEKRETLKLKAEMQKQRALQMIEANKEEDRTIKLLEKQLKLNKRSQKSIPKSFAADGLDYLLEVCDSEHMKDMLASEVDMNAVNDDFEEDFALVTGKELNKKEKKKKTAKVDKKAKEQSEQSDDIDKEDDMEVPDDEDFMEEDNDSDEDQEMDDDSEQESTSEKDPIPEDKIYSSPKIGDYDSDNGETKTNEESPEENSKTNEDGTWEDIYGRLRDKDGNVIQRKDQAEAYVPPAARASTRLFSENTHLLRTLKGAFNRLSERNLHSILKEIEDHYRWNSRNEVNRCTTKLVFESLLDKVVSSERLLLEHIVVIVALHANIGSETGTYFLHSCAKKFMKHLKPKPNSDEIEDKRLVNVVNCIAQMYNFKVCNKQLIYDILEKLTEEFQEIHIESILSLLKCVGFTLRKEDPVALKNMIISLQTKAAARDVRDNPRVKFMLEILLAIKNNNMKKIPNYDTSYSEHLKKILKTLIKEGSSVTPMHLTLEDLLKAVDLGRWWVVGAAWSRNLFNNKDPEYQFNNGNYPSKLLELAREMHMNTDTRKNVFCILMTATDYLDAYEKLQRLSLNRSQEKDMIIVIVHCCLSERTYNHYYKVVAQKFCDYDRRFQHLLKCALWDKLKGMDSCEPHQIFTLCKLLTNLIADKALPITTLKVVQFASLDATAVRFTRQILMCVLLSNDEEKCLTIFKAAALSDDKRFKENLRVFIYHFVLKNLDSDADYDEKKLLKERVQLVDKLIGGNSKRGNTLTFE